MLWEETPLDNLGMSQEDLNNSRRKVPVYAIKDTLTGEQKIYLEWDMIPAEYLNSAQLQTVEDALSFDVAVGHITWETSQKAYLCL